MFVSDEELSQWPAAAVAAMKAQKLLVKARPAASVVCPGCERECVMPVHTPADRDRQDGSFVVCDKRSDINRVPVSAETTDAVAVRAPTPCAGLSPQAWACAAASSRRHDARLLNIGIARGDKRSQMLCLRAEGDLALVAGNNAMPLAELIDYHDGAYSLDGKLVRQLVDAATTADDRYTPSNTRREARKLDTQAMYTDWQKAYRDLKRKRPQHVRRVVFAADRQDGHCPGP